VLDAIPGIDYRFKQASLLEQALTHKSVSRDNYERLEFLGDSLLNVVVSTRLFELYPAAPEGDLSRMRARIVRGRTLGELASGLSLGKYLNLGEGEKKSGGFRRASILADAMEAVFGAIYLDGGYIACRNVIIALCDPLIRSLPAVEELKDAKTRLQEWLQAKGHALPVYELVGEEGADHAKLFHVECRLDKLDMTVVKTGASRRKAEQAAAGDLLAQIASSKVRVK